MNDESILDSLRKRLVATIGTNGTIEGYNINQTIVDFLHDWNENLLDYVKYFKHKNLIDLIQKRLHNYIRIDYTNGIRICAIASEELSHCFDLINFKKPKKNPINNTFLTCESQTKTIEKENNDNETLNLSNKTQNKFLFTSTPIYIRKATLFNLISKDKKFQSFKVDLLKIMKCDDLLIYDRVSRKTFAEEDLMNSEREYYYKSF